MSPKVFETITATIWSIVGIITLSPSAKIASTTIENAESRIRSWSDAFGFGVQRVANAEAYFSLVLTLGTVGERHVIVSRPKKTWERYIIVEAILLMGDEHKKVFNSLTPAQSETVVEELLLQLSAAGQIAIIDPKMGTVTLQKRIPITASLTEDEFIRAVDSVSLGWMIARNAVVLALKHHTPTR